MEYPIYKKLVLIAGRDEIHVRIESETDSTEILKRVEDLDVVSECAYTATTCKRNTDSERYEDDFEESNKEEFSAALDELRNHVNGIDKESFLISAEEPFVTSCFECGHNIHGDSKTGDQCAMERYNDGSCSSFIESDRPCD